MTNNVKGTPIVKGLGFNSFGIGTNACTVDIDEEQDKILRIRPLHFDEHYTPEELNAWKIEARGKTFEPGFKTLISPLSLCLQEARVLQEPHPLPDAPRGLGPARRAPSGDARHQRLRAHQRGTRRATSSRQRSSACTTRTARPPSCASSTATARRSSSMRRTAARAACSTSSAPTRCRRANPTAGKAGTGAPSTSGAWTRWGRTRCRTTSSRTSPRTATRCCSGAATWRRRRSGWGGYLASRLCFWFTELGIKQIHIAPDVNYTNAVHADLWIPVKPNTDAALQLAIAYTWIKEGTYDQEYLDTHAVGFENFRYYVMGGEDGVPKTPKWAEKICGVPSYTIKALARYWAKHAVSIAHCNGGSFIRSCYAHEPARLEVALLGMQGVGKPGANQFKFIEWTLYGMESVTPLPPSTEIPDCSPAYRGWFRSFPKSFIPKTMIPEAIMNPPVTVVRPHRCRVPARGPVRPGRSRSRWRATSACT